LTPYCGLQVQKPTQALKSVKGPGNTLGGFLHLKPTVGCQISTLIFEFVFMEGGSLLISHEKYIKDGKVLDHLGLRSKVLPGPLTKLIFDTLLWA
jgi:hypothetical protein